MRTKVRPEDFVVEEKLAWAPAERAGGPFTLYRVHKRATTTLAVQAEMAQRLGLRHADVVFPALKDKEAVATQHATVRGSGPAHVNGTGFSALRLGSCPRPLTPDDIRANRFTLVLRDLRPGEEARLCAQLEHIARHGLPNYFDQQRFGSLAGSAEHIAKTILRRDVEGALCAYLTQPLAGDPEPVRRFKRQAQARWEDWAALFEAAPRPSNYRSVLTYLRDHPTAGLDPAARARHYRKALNLISPRLLSLYLAAYQAWLWNRIAARYLVALGLVRSPDAPPHIEVGGERLPLYRALPEGFARDLAIPLPCHTARYEPLALEAAAQDVLAQEGLALADLKARILRRAYLSRGERLLLLFPADLGCGPPEADERFAGRHKMTVRFTLPRGSYATLILRALDALGASEEVYDADQGQSHGPRADRGGYHRTRYGRNRQRRQ